MCILDHMTYILQVTTSELLATAEVLQLRRMTVPAAQLWLSQFKPDMSTEAREDVLAMVQSLDRNGYVAPATSRDSWKSQRNKFITAAWLAGASWYQLGQLFGVARETVRQGAMRVMSNADRAALRKPNTISWERLSAMRDAFAHMYEIDSDALRAMNVSVLATMLFDRSNDTIESMDAKDSPYDHV